MGGFIDRPFALLALLIGGFSAAIASAQTVQPVSHLETSDLVPPAGGDAYVLDMRLPKPLSRREEAALKPRDRVRE